jgi:serine/threonine protein phosphatase PrpC
MSEVHASYGFPLAVGVHSDMGRVRTNNEDSFGNAWLADGSLFVMVADGMGGHEAGEVASGLAVQVVEEVVGRDASADPRERLYNALLEANDTILEEGRRTGKAGMGTTSICAVVRGSEATIALVGDSRCYHIRHGHLVWRTVDHTRVQMLIDAGEIDEEQARVHPEAGMLTRALGHGRMADGRPLVPDVLAEPIRLEEQDALVLCSDGLHDLIEDWEIGRIVAGRTPQEAAEALVDLACERGGHDNVTVAVVVGGDAASDYDPNFVPPKPDPTEDTYPGYDNDPTVDSSLASQPRHNKAAAPPPSTGVFQPSEFRDEPITEDLSSPPPAAKKGGGSMMLWVIGGLLLLTVVGGGGFVLLLALGIVGWSFMG